MDGLRLLVHTRLTLHLASHLLKKYDWVISSSITQTRGYHVGCERIPLMVGYGEQFHLATKELSMRISCAEF
jgi:hypothetical protein